MTPPTRKGFGARLMASLSSDFGGDVSTDYAPEGLCWTVCAPLDRIREV